MMKAAHWVVVVCSAVCAVAPFVSESVPAKWAAVFAAVVAVAGTLKVEAVKAEQKE